MKKLKESIFILFFTAAALALVLSGCNQGATNSQAEKRRAEEQPTLKNNYQNEKTILKQLRSASPEEVIRAFFWGHSNHSKEVINATVYYDYQRTNSNYPEVKQWEVLEITRLVNPPKWYPPERLKNYQNKFDEMSYFKVKHRLTLNPGYDYSNTQLVEIAERGEIEWYFVLAKDRGSRWLIVSYGN